MKDLLYLTTDEQVKTAWNPYCLRILSALGMDALTVNQIAKKMNESHGKVHYHVQKLLSIDYLEIVKTESVRGITAKYYQRKYKMVDIADTVTEEIYVPYVTRAISSTFNNNVNSFRESMNKSKVAKSKKSNAKEIGDSIFNNLYLTEDEYLEFAKIVRDFSAKHFKKEKDKQKYGILVAVTIED